MESDKLGNIQYLGDHVEFMKEHTPIDSGLQKYVYDDGDYVLKVKKTFCKDIIKFLNELDIRNSIPGYVHEEFLGILMRKGVYPVTRQKKVTPLTNNPKASEIMDKFRKDNKIFTYKKAYFYKNIYISDLRAKNFGLDENGECVIFDCSILNEYSRSKL